MGWYLTITQEMRESLDLTGNELLVFALLNGYSQSGQGCYYGSLSHIRKVTGIKTDHTCLAALKSLMEKGYIQKTSAIVNGVKRVWYTTAEIAEPSAKIAEPTSAEIADNNKDIYINKSLSNKEAKAKFSKPSLGEVEAYCRERGNNVDAQTFIDFYESKGWVVGKTPMKDWRAAIRTWEQRDGGRRPQAQRPATSTQRPSAFQSNIALAKKMGMIREKEVSYDEQ